MVRLPSLGVAGSAPTGGGFHPRLWGGNYLLLLSFKNVSTLNYCPIL